MPKSDDELTIQDLAQQVGVPLRTIRYYIAQGLVPGPGARGKAAVYTQGHLQRLRLIRRLAGQRVPLAEIRERVSRLPDGEVRALLSEEDEFATGLHRAGGSASPNLYVSSLLRRPSWRTGRSESFVREKTSRREEPSFLFSPPSARTDTSAAESWRRWEVAPGVELHIRSDVVDRSFKLVEILRRAARAFRR